MDNPKVEFYNVFRAIQKSQDELYWLRKDALSPDLVYIEELRLDNLKIVLRDLARKLA